MSEEKTKTASAEISASVDTGEGDKPKEPTEVDKIHAAAKRMEKANETRAKIMQEEKEFEAKRILGGQTSAGKAPEPPKETTDQDRKDYYEDVLKGEYNIKKEK